MVYHLLFVFFIYAFLGWCAEVCYAATVSGRFVNRGFLNGPWCPVYGLGVVIVLSCLEPLRGNLGLLFCASVALTSGLEWLTGFALEKLFGQRWWDYSKEPFNLSGYICLRFSLMWGFACVFVVKLLHPTVDWLIRLIPHTAGVAALLLLSGAMAVDLTATVRAIARLNRRLDLIDQLAGKIRAASDGLGEDLAERVLDAAERGADWKDDGEELADQAARRRLELAHGLDGLKDGIQERLEALRAQSRQQLQEWRASLQEQLDRNTFGQRRLLRAFPGLRSNRHEKALERLRRRLDRR